MHEFKFRTEDVTKPDAFRLPSEFLDRLAAPSTSMGHVDMLVLQKADFTDTSNGILQVTTRKDRVWHESKVEIIKCIHNNVLLWVIFI